MKRKSFLITIIGFIWARKAYWILPAIVFLIVFISIIAVGTSPIAPFVYTLI